jgi:AraC-like DNA-binding protein
MKYREVKPCGFTVNFIQCFWEYETDECDLEHTIIPDGHFDLIAEFEDNSLKHVKLTGVWTHPVSIKIPKSTKLLAIRFKLLAAEYLFKQEIKSILNTAKDLPLPFWNIYRFTADDFEVFVTEITNLIENSIKHLKEIDRRKLELFESIYNEHNLCVKSLSESTHWSSRQINRYFNQQFGFSLKAFLNIVRCNSSYKNISQGNLFPEENYFDQSHFIKEIKKHTGTTPGELFRNENVRFLQLATKSQK